LGRGRRPTLVTLRSSAARGAPHRAEERENVLDLLFVGIVLVFFGLSAGYAAFCDRL
jgi:hypothetical protein